MSGSACHTHHSQPAPHSCPASAITGTEPGFQQLLFAHDIPARHDRNKSRRQQRGQHIARPQTNTEILAIIAHRPEWHLLKRLCPRMRHWAMKSATRSPHAAQRNAGKILSHGADSRTPLHSIRLHTVEGAGLELLSMCRSSRTRGSVEERANETSSCRHSARVQARRRVSADIAWNPLLGEYLSASVCSQKINVPLNEIPPQLQEFLNGVEFRFLLP